MEALKNKGMCKKCGIKPIAKRAIKYCDECGFKKEFLIRHERCYFCGDKMFRSSTLYTKPYCQSCQSLIYLSKKLTNKQLQIISKVLKLRDKYDIFIDDNSNRKHRKRTYESLGLD